MNNQTIIRKYINDIRPRVKAELDYFQQLPSLSKAIECAAMAVNSRGTRYNHQRRLKKKTLRHANKVLQSNSSEIKKCKNFDELLNLIDAKVRKIRGIGELYVYDTSLRIGKNLNLLPTKIYLHAGTRVGARALVKGLDSRSLSLEVSALPKAFQQLEPYEIEDVLCIFFKDELKQKKQRRLKKARKYNICGRSWCG